MVRVDGFEPSPGTVCADRPLLVRVLLLHHTLNVVGARIARAGITPQIGLLKVPILIMEGSSTAFELPQK